MLDTAHIGDRVWIDGEAQHQWCVVVEPEPNGVVGLAYYDGFHSPRERAEQFGVRWAHLSALSKVPTRTVRRVNLAAGEAVAMIDQLATHVIEEVWNHGDEIGTEIDPTEADFILRSIAQALLDNANKTLAEDKH